jgi:hypothetical protein
MVQGLAAANDLGLDFWSFPRVRAICKTEGCCFLGSGPSSKDLRWRGYLKKSNKIRNRRAVPLTARFSSVLETMSAWFKGLDTLIYNVLPKGSLMQVAEVVYKYI